MYINLGTNELGWPYIDTFKDYYTQLITKIQEIQPDAVIYAESILPVTASRSLQGDAINNHIQSGYLRGGTADRYKLS